MIIIHGSSHLGSLAAPSGAVSTFADAIQKMEGWKPGSISQTNNNPGNIMDLNYYRQTGKFRVQNYSSYAEGRSALEDLIKSYAAKGVTIEQMMAAYAPSGHGDNNPRIYANFVANQLGVSPSTRVSDVLNEPEGSNSESITWDSLTESPVGRGSLLDTQGGSSSFFDSFALPSFPSFNSFDSASLNVPLIAVVGIAAIAALAAAKDY